MKKKIYAFLMLLLCIGNTVVPFMVGFNGINKNILLVTVLLIVNALIIGLSVWNYKNAKVISVITIIAGILSCFMLSACSSILRFTRNNFTCDTSSGYYMCSIYGYQLPPDDDLVKIYDKRESKK